MQPVTGSAAGFPGSHKPGGKSSPSRVSREAVRTRESSWVLPYLGRPVRKRLHPRHPPGLRGGKVTKVPEPYRVVRSPDE